MRHILPSAGTGTSERRQAMARADTASASLRSDSIKGLAQSIANPAYRRLLTAEPLLRRAVPVLIIAFMLTICIGAAVQVLEHRRQVVVEATRTIEALADHLAVELDRPAQRRQTASRAHVRGAASSAAGLGRRARGRRILIADGDGTIIAGMPERAADPGPQHPRRARTVAAADHVRRRRRHAWRSRCRTAKPPSPRCGR